MTTENQPDIYLEMGTGFFRIPTPQATYHITILDSMETSATRVVEKIVEAEKHPEHEIAESENLISDAMENEDEFYRDISNELYGDIGQLARSLSSTLMEIPAEDRQGKRVELSEAGVKIEDAKNQLKEVVEMTEKAAMAIMDNVEKVQDQTNDVRELLSALKDHPSFQVNGLEQTEENGSAPPVSTEISQVREDLSRAREILAVIQSEAGNEAVAAEPEIRTEIKKLYLFDLDVVFQTLYELCTNETVKDHLTDARAKAEEIFDLKKFHDSISPKASAYEADEDNFFSVPMSDFFTSMSEACSEKSIRNLLKKMDDGQASIFLDQTIPLEVPLIEEIEIEVAGEETPSATLEAPEPDPRLEELNQLIETSLEKIDVLEKKSADVTPSPVGPGMSLEDQHQIFAQIENAFGVAGSICNDVSKITEALSFQDLSGQQIMKIIKLLSDFQMQLLSIVVSFGAQLKHKEKDSRITVDESKKLAQQDVDSYLKKVSGDEDEKEGGMLDQTAVNLMLEEMGF